MFSDAPRLTAAAASLPHAPTVDDLRDALDRLAVHDGAGLGEAELVEHLTAMEQLKSGLAAAQARVTATLASHRSEAEAAAGVAADERCRGLGHEVGLARQESPVRGSQHLGLGLVLVHELPHTLAALTRGQISEWRATLVARETAVLSRAHRLAVDAELADRLVGAGDKRVADLARKIGYRLDPGSALRRVRGAQADRRVGLRPAPDTMAYLTGFLPVAQGVACKAALEKEADRLRNQGDTRGRGQIMADTLVARVTGQTEADGTPVEIALVMTDRTLLGDDHTPAHLTGYGPVPASLARRLARRAGTTWVRRLYTKPSSNALVAMDSRRRVFDGELRQFLIWRDQTGRHSWCDAPIRHIDHVIRAAHGGATSAENAQGLCEACNQAKEAPGWRTVGAPGRDHLVETTTPTGQRHRSRAPDPPGPPGYPVHIDLMFMPAA
jgi:hypothetical protein